MSSPIREAGDDVKRREVIEVTSRQRDVPEAESLVSQLWKHLEFHKDLAHKSKQPKFNTYSGS